MWRPVRYGHITANAYFHGRRYLLSQAHARGPSHPALVEQTIPQHFKGVVDQYGDRPAVISHHQQRILTYAQLDQDSNALARGLKSVGIRKGERVAVSLGNNVEFATLTYALFKLGAVLVPLNPSFSTQQLTSALNHLGVGHLIIGAETNLARKASRSNAELLLHLVPDLRESIKVVSDTVPSLQEVVVVDNASGRVDTASWSAALPFESLTKNSRHALEETHLDKNDIVNIQFTSGTTSTPKAACLSHRNILNNGLQIGDRMRLSEADVVCCPPPLFHCFGCVLGYMATATHGSAIVFPSEAFDPHAALRAVQSYNATALYGVATMFLAELELLAQGRIQHEGFEHLRTGIVAGSSVPAELMRKLHRTLNLQELTICYGMTETSPVSCMTKTEDPLAKRVETVGSLLPHVEAKVVEIGNPAKTLAIGERGELAVSGYSVMKEYWEDSRRTAEVLVPDEADPAKLWMLTGDEASMDAEGYVSITGRIKDLIIRGGENIHPLEVENCLLANERISEVSVVGLPDDKYGEVVAAFIVRHAALSVEEVRLWVAERLSGHLVPKYVFWVDDYPKTASGKIQKFKLQEIGKALIGAGEGMR